MCVLPGFKVNIHVRYILLYNLCVELYFVIVELSRITHNLMLFYLQNIYNSNINNFTSTSYLRQLDIKAKQPSSVNLYDVISMYGV